MRSPQRPSVGNEVRRKLIHIASAVVPLLVWFSPRVAYLPILGLAVAVALLVEFSRARVRWVRRHFLLATRPMLRAHERRGIAGATYMAVGYLAAALLFPKPIAVAAMLYNALGDATAALVGRRWGVHRTGWGKSWEGAAAGFVINMATGFVVPGVPAGAAVIGAFVAAAIEFLPIPVDDNLRITIGGGVALWVATVALGIG